MIDRISFIRIFTNGRIIYIIRRYYIICITNILDNFMSVVIAHRELHYLMVVTNWSLKLVNEILGYNKFGEL